MSRDKKANPRCIRGLYPKRDKFVYQPPMVDGHRPKAHFLDTTDFAEAVRLTEEIRSKMTVDAITREIPDLIELFLKAKAAEKKHKTGITTDTAKSALNRFEKRFTSLRSITAANLESWRNDMYAEQKSVKNEDGSIVETDNPALSIATINGYLRYSQSLISWLTAKGYLNKSPFEQLTDFFPNKIPTKRENYCTKEERDKLIEKCDHIELKAVLFFGFHAGLRRNEILNLRPRWIIRDHEGRPTHVRLQPESGKDGTTLFTIKDDEPRTIPLTDPLAQFILDEELLDRTPYLIAPDIAAGTYKYRWEFKRRWASHITRCGLTDVTPHTMRHTFVTLLLSAPPEKRPSLLHLERWTGDNVETLKKSYAHLLEDRDLINAAN